MRPVMIALAFFILSPAWSQEAQDDDALETAGLTETEKAFAAQLAAPQLNPIVGTLSFPSLGPDQAASTLQQLRAGQDLGRIFVTDVSTIYEDPDSDDAAAAPGELAAPDKFARVQTIDYGTGVTTEYVVNVTKSLRLDDSTVEHENYVPPLGEYEKTLIAAIISKDQSLRESLGPDFGAIRIIARPINPAPLNTTRAALVRFELNSKPLLQARIVDLKNERIVDKSN